MLHLRICAAIALLLTFTPPAGAQMAAPVTMTPEAFAAAPVGGTVQIAFRVTSLDRTTLRGELLSPQNDTRYEATGKRLTLFFAEETPIVMGSARDIVSGAVVAVDGVVTARDRVDAKRLVVLTKYVTIVPHKP